MQIEKRVQKLRYYWVENQDFRFFVWENFKISENNKISCMNLWSAWHESPYNDLCFDRENELWAFLVGFHFPERDVLNERSLLVRNIPFHSLGLQLGESGKIWKMMSWTADKMEGNKPWPGGMPYDVWGVSDQEFLSFYHGLHGSKYFSKNEPFYCAGQDLQNEKINKAILKLQRNSHKNQIC